MNSNGERLIRLFHPNTTHTNNNNLEQVALVLSSFVHHRKKMPIENVLQSIQPNEDPTTDDAMHE